MANDLQSQNIGTGYSQRPLGVDESSHYDDTNDDPTVVQTFPSGSEVGEESQTPSYHNEQGLYFKD